MLAQPLSSQNQGYSDTVYLNGVLEYADGTAITIGSDEYIPVVLAPNTATAEEAWLTTTPAGSPYPSATLIRGTGSSTGAPAHTLPCVVAHGPTPYDKLLSIDDPWAGNLGYDYEFPGDGSTLPSYSYNGGAAYTWTWLNQASSSTYAEAWGRGVVAGSSSNAISAITAPMPSPSAWSAYFKIYHLINSTNYNTVGVTLGQGGTKWFMFHVWSNNTIQTQTYTSFTGGNVGVNSVGFTYLPNPIYMRVRQNSTSSYDFMVSAEGTTWQAITSAYNPGSAFTSIGFGAVSANNSPVSCQFFRVR